MRKKGTALRRKLKKKGASSIERLADKSGGHSSEEKS